jgi:hypothetical protein
MHRFTVEWHSSVWTVWTKNSAKSAPRNLCHLQPRFLCIHSSTALLKSVLYDLLLSCTDQVINVAFVLGIVPSLLLGRCAHLLLLLLLSLQLNLSLLECVPLHLPQALIQAHLEMCAPTLLNGCF